MEVRLFNFCSSCWLWWERDHWIELNWIEINWLCWYDTCVLNVISGNNLLLMFQILYLYGFQSAVITATHQAPKHLLLCKTSGGSGVLTHYLTHKSLWAVSFSVIILTREVACLIFWTIPLWPRYCRESQRGSARSFSTGWLEVKPAARD